MTLLNKNGMNWKMRISIVTCLVLGQTLFGTAQEVEPAMVDTAKRKVNFVFSVGGGISRFMGDVQDESEKVNVNLLGNRPVADLTLGASLSKSFTLNFNAVYGKLSGNQNSFKEHRNFDTQMLLLGANVEYNFGGLWKKRIAVLNPFISAGAYYGNYFNISTDVLNADNNPYHYWSDGKIRELEENAINRDLNLPPISRDFDYETQLVNGSVHTFTASAGFGLDLHLSRAFTVRLMSRYFFAVSDNLDGHKSGIQDSYFVNQLSLVVNTMAFSKARRGEQPDYKFLFDPTQLVVVENEDTDNDGVKDVVDLCAATPAGVEVDINGCPLDTDIDGVPDYRDKQKNSVLGAIVDRDGVPVDYKVVAQFWGDTLGVNRILWKKEYVTGDPIPNEGYTVNIKTLKTGTEGLLNPVVGGIKELRKKVINDSLILFTLGVYDHFEDAELRSSEIDKLGEKQSYGVLESESERVAEELDRLSKNLDPELKGIKYGVRKNLVKIKKSEAYGNTTLGYTVGRLERHLDNNVPEYLLVKDFLNGTAPFTSDSIVAESFNEVKASLEQFPIVEKPIYLVGELKTEEVSEEVEETFVADTMKVKSLDTQAAAEAIEKTNQKQINTAEIAQLPAKPKGRVTAAPIKPVFKKADLDADGFITATEIEQILQEILEGHSEVTVSQFNEMVQYYTYFTDNADPIDFGGTEVVIIDGVLSILKTEGNDLPEESRRILAKKYKEADFNGDGDLTPDEVQKMIKQFMAGNKTYSSDKIYELIDLYFD